MNYCNNKQFLELLKKYQESHDKKIANEIGKIMLLICHRFLKKLNFSEYTDDRKDDMISEATFYMWKYVDRFDTSKDNPFAYFTTFVKNAFLQYINERNRYDKMFTSIDYIEFFKNHEINVED